MAPLPVLLILFAAAILFAILFFSQKSKNKSLFDEIVELRAKNESLSPYEGIVDAEVRASDIITSAIEEGKGIRQQADDEIRKKESEIKKLRQETLDLLETTRQDSNARLETARIQAKTLIEAAEAEAKKIAGDAYTVLENLQMYEKALRAIKHTIDGYGNEYFIPSRSLLDDLAEEYGYTAAAQDLKELRTKNRMLVKDGRAAECDYAESNRRITAVNFVTDAFNGKVDSILSRSKADNYGKLRQEILDAFILVNKNGQAFRNARITEEYLQSRLEELRLAVVLQEIKEREREEQRAIKEQIREEEKARREIERALRDAQKEEEMLQKAMEKIRGKFEQASEEQKAMYEQQLAELEQKVKEAEERNQRALSMAQQTKSGHVYVISNVGSFGEDVYKIGMTRRLEPNDRVRELGDASVPFAFDVHAMIWSEDAPALETRLHKTFALSQVNKVNYRKEFFKAPLNEIRSEIDNSETEVKWTIAAEAKQYRESQAIDKAIAENPEMKEAWLNRQWTFENHAQRDEESLLLQDEESEDESEDALAG